MIGRFRIIMAFVALGFLSGVIAYFTLKVGLPFLAQAFPFLLTTEWFISGLLGAAFTLIVVVMWAYLSK